ncbi:MAG: hypothetical protein ACYC5Y_00210 [Symbiobacteriia bacterium]
MSPIHPSLIQPLRALSQAWEGIEVMGEAAAVDQLLASLPPDACPDWLPPLLAQILRARSHAELEACREAIARRLAAETQGAGA